MYSQPRPFPYNQGHLPNGANHPSSSGAAGNNLANNGRVIQSGATRILCIADVRGEYTSIRSKSIELQADDAAGQLKSLNEIAQKAGAHYVIHTGDFGFYDEDSLKRIADKSVFDSSQSRSLRRR